MQLLAWLMQQYDTAAPADRPQLSATQFRALLSDDWRPAAAVQAVEAAGPAAEVEIALTPPSPYLPSEGRAVR